jgi:hypothetical protein
VDLDDVDSVLESAPALQALANSQTLILDALNDELRKRSAQDQDIPAGYSAQTLVLARRPRFSVRLNIWLPASGTDLEQESERRLSAYGLPHDHDFSFLTVGYFGPGYTTTIWQYEREAIDGLPGEPVDLEFLERTWLPAGKTMFYRRSKDIHTQEPPTEISASVNLLLNPPEGPTSQYVFDTDRGRIAGVVPNAAESWTSLCSLAGIVGNSSSAGHLQPLLHLDPESSDALLTSALADRDPAVRAAAMSALAGVTN